MSEELIGAAALTSRYVLGFVLLAAAIPKLADRREFERAVRNYRLLPDGMAPVVATWLPRLELVCALALLLGVAVAVFAGLAALLLGTLAVAIAVNLVRGRSIECGCRGSIAPKRIGWGLVVGDVALGLLAVLVVLRDPGALALTASETVVSASDGIALMLVAASLVVAWLVLGSALDLVRVHRAAQASVGAQ